MQNRAYKVVEATHDTTPITDVFLIGVMATWGATIDANEHPGLAHALVTEIIEMQHAIVLEPDSVPKFLVSASPGNIDTRLVTNTSQQALVAMVCPRTPALV